MQQTPWPTSASTPHPPSSRYTIPFLIFSFIRQSASFAMKTALESVQSYLGLFCEDRKPKRRGSASPHVTGRHSFSRSAKDVDHGSAGRSSSNHQHPGKKLSSGKVSSSSHSIDHNSMSLANLNHNLSSFDACNGSAVSTASRRNIVDIIRGFGSRHRNSYGATSRDDSISSNKPVQVKQLACQAIRNDTRDPFDECTSEYYGASSRKSGSGCYSSLSSSSSSSTSSSVSGRRKGLEFERGELLSFDGNVELPSSDTETEASEGSIMDKRDHDPSGFTVDSIGHVFSHDHLDKMITLQHKSDMKHKQLEGNVASASHRLQHEENFIVPNCLVDVQHKSLEINHKKTGGNTVEVSQTLRHEDEFIVHNKGRLHDGTPDSQSSLLIVDHHGLGHVHSTSTTSIVHENESVREDVNKEVCCNGSRRTSLSLDSTDVNGDSFRLHFNGSRRTSLTLESTTPSLPQCLCLETPMLGPNSVSAAALLKQENMRHQLESSVSKSSTYQVSQYHLNVKRSDDDEDDGSDWDIGSFPLLPATKSNRRKFPPPLNSLGVQGESSGTCGAGYCFRSVRRDGRFVLQEVKPPIHKYFKVSRKDGCLKLQLINPLIESSLNENEKTDHQHDAGCESNRRSVDEQTNLLPPSELGKLSITECHSPNSIPNTVINVMSTDKELVSDETDENTTSPSFSDVRIRFNSKSSGMKNSWLHTISAF